MCKLPHRLDVWGYTNSRPPARTNTSTLLQAGFVRGRAISNRLVFIFACIGMLPSNVGGIPAEPTLNISLAGNKGGLQH